jgi:two-component system, NtrC family, response regulator AtoC
MLGGRKQILVADDEANIRRVVSAQLQADGHEVHEVGDGAQAIEALKEHHIDAVVTDLRMGTVDGLAVLRYCQEHCADLPVIMITAYGTIDIAVEAMRLGAFDFVAKPFDLVELRNVIAKALRTSELRTRDVQIEGLGKGRYKIISNDPAMVDVYGILDKVADTPATVLISGESGTGKELIARALHENSSRKDKPFIRVNCGAIPRDLMEAELFGYERGSFTGAVNSKPGRFELAHGGTLFLDEIGEIPVEMQVKLLRAIQEGEIDRVGGIKPITVDVRLISASNRELKKEIVAGRFREDLYYRLNVVPIHLPPLRERRGDIPLLVEHFLGVYAGRFKKPVSQLSAEARDALLAYGWPGNIRELENVIERCVLLADDNTIRLRDLSTEVRSTAGSGGGVGGGADDDDDGDPNAPGGLKGLVRERTRALERDLIMKALDQTNTNVTQAARLLKISRKSLQIKMKELGLREPAS